MKKRYKDVKILIEGKWRDGQSGEKIEILNKEKDEVIGNIEREKKDDIEDEMDEVDRGFEEWRKVQELERYKIMSREEDILRRRGEEVERILKMEKGKKIEEERIEEDEE